jgi:hypothetical protein
MKLLKLSEYHYVIIETLPKSDDWVIHSGNMYIDDTGAIRQSVTSDNDYWKRRHDYNKITHSTKPLEQYYSATDGSLPFVYHKVKRLSHKEVNDKIEENVKFNRNETINKTSWDVEFDDSGNFKII